MIEIEQIIELQTNSETEKLLFRTRFLVDQHFTFYFEAKSREFGGKSHFCVSRSELKQFSTDLLRLHSDLEGVSHLSDYDSDSYIKFEINKSGQLFVTGQIGGSHEDHFMKFTFQTDQTCIPKFVRDIQTLTANK
jgi:hypothetical protein